MTTTTCKGTQCRDGTSLDEGCHKASRPKQGVPAKAGGLGLMTFGTNLDHADQDGK